MIIFFQNYEEKNICFFHSLSLSRFCVLCRDTYYWLLKARSRIYCRTGRWSPQSFCLHRAIAICRWGEQIHSAMFALQGAAASIAPPLQMDYDRRKNLLDQLCGVCVCVWARARARTHISGVVLIVVECEIFQIHSEIFWRLSKCMSS